MNPTRPLGKAQVVVGRGAGLEPKTIAAGTAGQVLTQVTLGADPAFAAPAAVDLTTGVTGVLPKANGGTGNAVGPIVTVPFGPVYGTAVAAGSNPTFLGRDEDATELNVQFRFPTAGTVTAMYTQASVAAGAAQTFVYTLRLATADTALTCTTTGTGGGGRSSFATGGSVVVAANDVGSVKLVTSAGAGVSNHTVTLALQVQN